MRVFLPTAEGFPTSERRRFLAVKVRRVYADFVEGIVFVFVLFENEGVV
jgi:hypothetical protein